MCIIGILLAIILLIFIIIYLCLTSMRQKNKSIVQIPLPSTTSSQVFQPKRSVSNRISTISSSTSSDGKSRCTDTSIILNTPLNRYPTTNSRNSTTSSYYIYPNEFEYLCE